MATKEAKRHDGLSRYQTSISGQNSSDEFCAVAVCKPEKSSTMKKNRLIF
jgi:hypothetical protein